MDQEKRKILVIDDSITNVVLLNAILSEEGYEIITVFNVSDAFNEMNKHFPDLVLLDLQMPVLDGFDFLEKIKSKNRYKDIPIIVVTAYCDDANINKALSLGANDYIEKPIDIDQLYNKISKTLNYACH
ncbi:response regulator [Bacteroidota bacterium]